MSVKQKHTYLLQKNQFFLNNPEYVLKKNKSFSDKTTSSFTQSVSSIKIHYFEDNPPPMNSSSLMNKKHESIYNKPIEELYNTIINAYSNHQMKNWDGYGAEPIKYLRQSLAFAKALFSQSRLLIETVEIAPENDGCLCFEWFKTHSRFINVSIKSDKLIYDYEIGDDKGCGETTFSGKKMIIGQIKRVI